MNPPEFPEYACPYARRLAASSPRFAMQVYDPPPGSVPTRRERYGTDPFGELASAAGCYALKQRFPDRVLVMTSSRCFMNCRHCTRRGLLGRAEVVRTDSELAACVDYVRARPEVRDVLLSGGDTLTLPDREVQAVLRRRQGHRRRLHRRQYRQAAAYAHRRHDRLG